MKLKKIIIMALCLSLVMTCGVFLAACNKGDGDGGGLDLRQSIFGA